MKGIYINSCAISHNDAFLSSGVNKKIIAQVETLKQYFDIELELHDTSIIPNDFFHKIKRRLPFTAIEENWIYNEAYREFDFIYFRKNKIDYTVCRLFREIKRHNPECKILLEIPTYPYDKEILLNGLKEYPYLLKDILNRKKLKKYVDRIVTFSEDETIYGIPTIRMINGIDFSKIEKRIPRNDNTDIQAIAVAYFNNWHGYDRFLIGLGEYYKNGGSRKIVFHLVGDGMSIPEYKYLVEKYDLRDKVVFHGLKSGKELDDIYNQSNLAISTMGIHRKNCNKDSSLKAREYAAKGLPIIGTKTDLWSDDYPYQLIIPSDETAVDMEEVIKYFDRIYCLRSAQEVNDVIRDDAMQKCDMGITMLPVIKYLKLSNN